MQQGEKMLEMFAKFLFSKFLWVKCRIFLSGLGYVRARISGLIKNKNDTLPAVNNGKYIIEASVNIFF